MLQPRAGADVLRVAMVWLLIGSVWPELFR